LPLHTRRRVIEAVLNAILGLHNKPKAAVRSVHNVTGRKKKEEEEEEEKEEEKEEEEKEEEEEEKKKNTNLTFL
jgi:Sec-independent protein translocase protein TatA